jgi:hypothetical protein
MIRLKLWQKECPYKRMSGGLFCCFLASSALWQGSAFQYVIMQQEGPLYAYTLIMDFSASRTVNKWISVHYQLPSPKHIHKNKHDPIQTHM